MNADKTEFTTEQAKALLEREKKARVEACLAAINDVLAQFQCELAGEPGITADGRIVCRVAVVAK